MSALMAAACLRENHWQVHHLSADLPAAEISMLTGTVGASLVVLSTATTGGAARAAEAARAVRAAAPDVIVLIGHPGDTLADLVRLTQHLADEPAPAG